jgi:hypothetical protein
VIRLVNRYDLEVKVASGRGRTLWQGHDVVLDRPVGVLILDADHPHADEVRAAAQAAARVEHPHVLRVVDADTSDGCVVVITRWLEGNTLAELLSGGPLASEQARSIVSDVAEALAAAANEGVHHLVLDPRDVLVTDNGVVLVGVGVRAALEGVSADGDAQAVDAWRLGALLYAALTARWPGHPTAGLPAAPTVAGRVARPRQVRAGVSPDVDDIAWRALQPDVADPLETPAAVAAALAAISEPAEQPESGSPARQTPWLVVVATVVAMLFIVGASLVAWQVWQSNDRPRGVDVSPTAGGQSLGSTPSVTPEIPLHLVSAAAFDPAGNGQENDDDAALAIDGDPATSWQTLTYTTRDLGQLKPGVGLTVQLDGQESVGGIELTLVGQGTDLQIFAKQPGSAKPSVNNPTNGYRRLASIPGAGDQLTYRFAPPVETTSILIWLTGLPAQSGGYRGGIAEVRLVS